MTSATTPESGTVTTYYTTTGGSTCSTDSNAVCRRTDARNITATYSYDGLNRLTGISYSDGTPAATYAYDAGGAAANALGRLTSLADGGGTESYTYDVLGRVTHMAKVISGTSYGLGYGYDNSDQLTSIKYPSGRIVTQSYDSIERLQKISSSATDFLTINSTDYTAAFQPLALAYGNGVTAAFTYNDHLQVGSIRYTKTSDLLNLTYGYGANNNGQIQSITDNLDASKSTSYVYDAWGRISQATAGPSATPTWKLSWNYDRFGNRLNQNVIGGTGFSNSVTVSATTNRITTAGYAYDAAGNLTNDTFHSYAYDAENCTKTVDTTAATYSYVGALRVKKVAGATTTVYIFSGSKVIAEYVNGALSKEYVYSGSTLLATLDSSGTPTYRHNDHLSARLETDSAGNVARSFGHYPFGEAWYETGTASKWKFTSYERDGESGVDYAIFRYGSTRLGRFMSPDLLAGQTANPQSLNRYAYVLNNPPNYLDPLGLDCTSYLWVSGPGEPEEIVTVCAGGGGSGGGGGGSHPTPGLDLDADLGAGGGGDAKDAAAKQPCKTKPLETGAQTTQQQLEAIGGLVHIGESGGVVLLGGGLVVTGVVGTAGACTYGVPLLCFAALEAAPAFVVGGYQLAKSGGKELKETFQNPGPCE